MNSIVKLSGMNTFKSLLTVTTVFAMATTAAAQYPVIPEAMEKKADSLMEQISRRRGETWKALHSLGSKTC
jgi:hypothetical protein